MALGDGGLDAQVEQRMDAYRGNPQQLQKRYGQNKELMDLLALQKLKTEKEQTAQAMAMEAQQQPGTIAEQREAEALELVKQEQAGTLGDLQARTKGTLDQKQKMQGKGMNKIAQSAGKPPQQAGGIAGLMGGGGKPPMPPQGGPQAAGLPNARMMQAARGGPVRRMAQGGIVGFVGGKEVKKKRTLTEDQKQAFRDKFGGAANRLINQVEAGTLGPLSSGTDTRNEIATILGDSVAAPPERRADPLGLANPPRSLGDGEGASLGGIPSSYGVPGQMQQPPAAGIQTLTKPEEKKTDFVGPDMGGVDAYTQVPTVEEEPAFEISDGSDAPQIELPDKPALVGGKDPMDAMQEGFAAANKETGRFEKAAEYEDMLAEMKAFDAENYDPERERRDRLKTFLMGAAGTTNVGATFAQAGASSLNLENKQRVDRRSRLQDKFNMQKSKMATDAALAQTSVGLGKELYSQASQDNRTAMQIASQMRGQDLTTLTANADRIMKKAENDNTNSYRLATLALDQNKLDAKILNDENTTKNARIEAANTTLFRTIQAREALVKQANDTLGVESLKAAIEFAVGEEEKAAAYELYKKAADEAIVLAETLMNGYGRGVGERTDAYPDGEPTGTSLLDAEQFAIQILAGYGLDSEGNAISEDDITSVTTTGN